MKSKTICLYISASMLARIDSAAKANFTSHSGFIRQALALRLNDQYIVSELAETSPGDNLFDL